MYPFVLGVPLRFNRSAMSKRLKYYLLFFVALAIGFYFILTKVIPGYATPKVVPVSYIRPFAFTNQDGKIVTEKDVAGKIYVAQYFFTTCKSICPVMNNYMKEVYEALKNEKDFLILSHTCMPEVDSVAVLKKYADSMQVNTNKWIFLTGRKDSLYTTARVSYTIDDPANNVNKLEDEFMHTQFWALVDKNGDVIRIYDGLKKEEINDLIKDIRQMLERK
jgi:protein SCO1